MTRQDSSNRRDFLKIGAAATLGSALVAGGVHAAGDDKIKVGIIGCGSRGTDAGNNVLEAADGVTIVALGDAFKDRLQGCVNKLKKVAQDQGIKKRGNGVAFEGNTYVGLDAYKKVLDTPGLNYVILATPPGFRPVHLEAAVNSKKNINIFTEKPVGVDGPGLRKVFEAYKTAQKKKIGIAAGTQRRHMTGYLEVMKRIHQGDIGKLVGGHCHWNQGILWNVPRKKGWKDLEAQMRNWYNYTWLCGDHIVEQHVHNIDVVNWAFQSHPKAALGMGFQTRKLKDFGHIFDFFSVDFDFGEGAHVVSTCRQISGCSNSISEGVRGTKGWAETSDVARRYQINGKSVFDWKKNNRPYVQEHTDLIASIRKGEPINELKNVAESTLSAIMGRMSAYTGQRITWEQALNSKENLMPEKLDWEMELKEPEPAMPGKTKFV